MISFLSRLFSRKGSTMKNYSPQEVHEMLTGGTIVLIDVRETDEHDSERIQGAVPYPLSSFDPRKLPNSEGKIVVFHCAGGIRSAKAVAKCLAVDLPYGAHLAGGLGAWKSAGLPTVKSRS